ncbi:hypothetical protein ADL02_12800 [Streptomyces sp. NRRL WC-3723]|nr:hypothetical protein ADL02_12800 [Streptomyces sp. NRRL WC-3723]
MRPTSLPLDKVTLLGLDGVDFGEPENLEDVIQMGGDPQDHVTPGDPAGAVQRRAVYHDVQIPGR